MQSYSMKSYMDTGNIDLYSDKYIGIKMSEVIF